MNPTKPGGLRLAWVSLSVLAFTLVFVSWYPLGGTREVLAIKDFWNTQQTVLLFTLPPGLGLILGFILSLRTPPQTKKRFLWSILAVFAFQITLTRRFGWFIPFFIWCSGILPNPAGWGLIFLSAGMATFLSSKMDLPLKESGNPRRLARMIAGASVAILSIQAAFLAPIFHIEWRKAPAVLDDDYYLAWEIAIPASSRNLPAGFWFESRQVPPDGLSPLLEFTEPSAVSESEEAVLITDRWIGRVRLSDGKLIWGKDFSFRVSDGRRDQLCVYVSEDRIHVIVHGPPGSIHTFRRSDGELMWELRDLPLKYGRAGAVPTPNFILAAYADGRPSYVVIDSRTGAVTEHPLPIPEGMVVSVAGNGESGGAIGPVLLEGYGGSIAILAYFCETETLPQHGQSGVPILEEGHLFGIDRETGAIRWHVRGLGNWREDLTWSLDDVWFDDSSVVWTVGFNPGFVRVWDTATGSLRWSKDYPSGFNCARACPDGVVVRETDRVLRFYDVNTGDVRWSCDSGASDTHSVFFMGDTLVARLADSLTGIRTSDGSVVFNMTGSYQIRRLEDGGLIVERRNAGSSRTVLVNPKTGEKSPFTKGEFTGPWDLDTAQYLLSLKGDDGREGSRYLFKAEGKLWFFHMFVHPVQDFGSLGEVTKEGGILVTAYDEKAGVYHLYLIRSGMQRP